MNRRASCVGTFEVFEAAHVALRTLLAFSQPVNCIFWPIGMLNWLVAASKLHKHRETCCTAEWPFYSFLILCNWCKYCTEHAHFENASSASIKKSFFQNVNMARFAELSESELIVHYTRRKGCRKHQKSN